MARMQLYTGPCPVLRRWAILWQRILWLLELRGGAEQQPPFSVVCELRGGTELKLWRHLWELRGGKALKLWSSRLHQLRYRKRTAKPRPNHSNWVQRMQCGEIFRKFGHLQLYRLCCWQVY